MSDKKDTLAARLLAAFRAEAAEHAQSMSAGLLRLEKRPPAAEASAIVETVYRDAHSLKGAARAVKAGHIEAICHPLESLFAEMKAGRRALTPPLADLMHRAVALVEAIAESLPADGHDWQAETAVVVRGLDAELTRKPGPERVTAAPAAAAEPARPRATAASRKQDTVRVDTAKLDDAMRAVGELLAPRLAARQRARDLRSLRASVAELRKRASANEDAHLRVLEDQVTRLERAADADRRLIDSLTDGIQRQVLDMQLQPWSTVLDLFAREARELARNLGKGVEVVVAGGDIEVDRRLLDEIRSPLLHLVRNAIDHGIDRHGEVRIDVTRTDSGSVTVVVEDDGDGVDLDEVKRIASERSVVTPDQLDAMTDDAALELVFHSGLSTSPMITELSGRGLGLAIVREKVEQLGGRIGIESTRGHGTRFTMQLPVRLATFRGTLVSAGGAKIAIPSANIDRVARLPASAVHTSGRLATAVVDGQPVAFVRLTDALGGGRPSPDDRDDVPAVVIGRGATRVAFGVDDIVDEQEVLVKPLGPLLKRVRNIAGACVLGDGEVVPVVNVADLLASAAARPTTAAAGAVAVDEQAELAVLVAEDSITSRALMKSILETAGYRVTTAVDGVDALTKLKTGDFDLVVSDIDMPRLDGVTLTTRIRADERLADLPVILVTTMSSQTDRERGVEVGANAYIVKSSFDQGDLLEMVRRLT